MMEQTVRKLSERGGEYAYFGFLTNAANFSVIVYLIMGDIEFYRLPVNFAYLHMNLSFIFSI